jgi:hypothetical protein
MHDAGLSLVGGHHHHLGALGPGHQLVQCEDGGEAALALPSWEHPPGQPRPRLRIPGRGDQGTLPGPQTKRLPGAMATRHPYVVGGEPRDGKLPASGAAQGQRGVVNGRFGAGLHGLILAS